MSAIRPGDLVQVVRPQPCCGAMQSIGKVFVVASVWHGKGFCDCGAMYSTETAFERSDAAAGYVASRLKKIDPPALDEDEVTDQELVA